VPVLRIQIETDASGRNGTRGELRSMETEHFWWWKKEGEVEVAEVGFYSGIPRGQIGCGRVRW